EASTVQCVAFDVAATALLFPVFLGMARLCRERCETPVRGKREIHVVAVWIEETRANDRRFEIGVPHDLRHATEVAKRALVQPQKRFELLIPDRFFVSVPRVPERHPKHPWSSPFAGRGIERRRPAEEIDLRLGSG